MNEPITIIRSTAVPLPVDNIDTDQIIPARFLKRTDTHGWGEFLFHDWRFEAGNPDAPVEDFVLNDARRRGSILVAGKNFGCGSSREHAVWALKGSGFQAVVSPMFADIFRSNALNNFLLPVEVSEAFVQHIFHLISLAPGTRLEVDLQRQMLRLSDGSAEAFSIDAFKKRCLLDGHDDLDYLLSLAPDIRAFEQQRNDITY